MDPAAYPVDALLIDSGTADIPGGTGQALDWQAARVFIRESQTPVVLAGGLTPQNVETAIATAQPWGVDVSTGVEARLREKDLAKVEEFIHRCRTR